jgi:hypothetical protein
MVDTCRLSRGNGGGESPPVGCSRNIALGRLRRPGPSLWGLGGCVSQTPRLQNPILRFLPGFG